MGRHSDAHRKNTLNDLQLYHCILLDRYEIIQAIGDGSFGTVSLGRRRKLGHAAQLVAIKSMKQPIDPPQDCLKLREIQSLHVIPKHPAIVPVLEAFYDPSTRLFHMVMEHMEQNLYQLIKSRNGQTFDLLTVKKILSQILDGLRHCHYHNYFHRDIKPENILVTCSRKHSAVNSVSPIARFSTRPHYNSRFITPPATPVEYCVKLADFGLAREIDSRPPYTIYVSTRWYRAPEVLLRAGEYSAPVDMWAFGAMAVELATLKPLFPGSHEIDQVWKVCEIMGSPGDWRDRADRPVGGGVWDDGYKLAQNLGFTFPKTPPRPLEGIIGPSWPVSFCQLVTKLLSWDPNARPTSAEALQHELFRIHDTRMQSPISKTSHGQSASLSPWVDRTHVVAESVKDNSGNVHESLQRRLYGQHRDGKSTDADLQSWPNQPHPQEPSESELVASSPQRLSWFARKRNSFIGRAPRVGRDDVLNSDTPEKCTTSPKHSSAMVKSLAPPHNHKAHNDQPSIPSLPQIRHSSPLKDRVLGKSLESSQADPHAAFVASTQRRLSRNVDRKWDTSPDITSNSARSGIPLRTPLSYTNMKMSRSISETSADQYSPLNAKCQDQSFGSSSQTHSGLSSLFSHLRKRTKRSEQAVPLAPQRPSLEQNPSQEVYAKNSPEMCLNRVPVDYRDQDDNSPIAINQNVPGQSDFSEDSPMHRRVSLLDRTTSVHRSTSVPEFERQVGRQKIKDSSNTLVVYPKIYKTESSRHEYFKDGPTGRQRDCLRHNELEEESELLNEELRSTSLALERLQTSQDKDKSQNRHTTVPSYAKSTAASARRSSMFLAQNGRKEGVVNAEAKARPSSKVPLNSLHSAFF